jgi:hypothetical protein
MTRMIAISVSGERGCPGFSAVGAACAVGLIIASNKSIGNLFIMLSLLYELMSIASLRSNREAVVCRTRRTTGKNGVSIF